MRLNTLIMLLISVVFGALAVFFANLWLTGQRQAEVPGVSTPVLETSTIVVAARDLSFGEPLQAEVLREIPWPKSSVPEGAFAKITELTGDGRHVVLSPLGLNEPVLKWKISGPGARASLSAIVGEGMRAVGIRLNDVAGAGGFVLPGDRVDVLYTKTRVNDDPSSTDILIQNVQVLAINQLADRKQSDPVVAAVATLEVTTVDAQKIALAQSTGMLSLSLRAAGSLERAPAVRIVEQELVSSASAYLDEFNARKAAQDALDARLKGLEGSVAVIDKKIDTTAGEGARKLTDVESKLRSEIATADATGEALKKQYAALQDIVKQTAAATGKGQEALRDKLLALEQDIRSAADGTNQGDAALRSKLAGFEAILRNLANMPPRVVVAEATDQAPVVIKPLRVSVGVFKGTAPRQNFEVPPDAAAE